MKVIELERRTMDGEPVIYDTLNECAGEYRDWWCVIETKEEELFYDKYVYGNKGLAGETNAEHIWNEMVKHAGQDMGISWGDDDMYGYIRPGEKVPKVGEEFVDSEGDRWVRRK